MQCFRYISYISVYIFLALGYSGCTSSSPGSDTSTPSASQDSVTQTTSSSDTSLGATTETLASEEVTGNLLAFDHNRTESLYPKDFTISQLKMLTSVSRPVSAFQRDQLSVSDYFEDLTFDKSFVSYLFVNKSKESHYGDSFELRTITRKDHSIYRLTLAQEYLSENYEKRISSTMISQDTIVRKIMEHSVSQNDKEQEPQNSETIEEYYVINSNGSIEQLKSE